MISRKLEEERIGMWIIGYRQVRVQAGKAVVKKWAAARGEEMGDGQGGVGGSSRFRGG